MRDSLRSKSEGCTQGRGRILLTHDVAGLNSALWTTY